MKNLLRLLGFPGAGETSHRARTIVGEHPHAKHRKGDLIGDAYEVRGILGVGGFGVVYLVRSQENGAVFALKTLRNEWLGDEESRKQFRNEAKIWIDLERHPNLVQATFIEELAGDLCIGMEYIEPDDHGLNSLEGYLQDKPPDLLQSLRWAIQVCHGMEYAHQRGIRAHRDLKPANLLITRTGVVKVTDFGFANIAERGAAGPAGLTPARRKGMMPDQIGFGTPAYMSPEQFLNASRCDARSDIYSFGIILYQMANRGRVPFPPPRRRTGKGMSSARVWREMHRLHSQARVPPLSSPMFPVIQQCLEKEPRGRYQSFRELRLGLESLLLQQAGAVETPQEKHELEAWELYNKALSLSNLGHLEEAILYYERTLALEPGNGDAWNNKGVCLWKLGRIEDSLRCYDQAVAANPGNASAWGNRGNSLFKLGRLDEALVSVDRALAIDPSNESALLNRGFTLDRLGRHSEAAGAFRLFLALPPTQYLEHADRVKRRLAEIG